MYVTEAFDYLTKEILKVFADNAPDGYGQTICTYGENYNVVAYHTYKKDKIQYHISFIISKNAVVSCSASIFNKENVQEDANEETPEKEAEKPTKTWVYSFDKLDTRTLIQKKAISKVEKILIDNNTLFRARHIEAK